MLFVQFRFFLFFLVVFAIYWSLRNHTARKAWLVICSYFFYAAWNWKFLFLLMASTALDYLVGRMLAKTEDPRRRRVWLTVSLCGNLGTLAFFKYYNFFVTSAAQLLQWLGLPASLQTLNIIIPVGISFYTFHSMSYTIDLYRRKLRPVLNVIDLASFIGFFPQMVAGPIVRAAQFLPQLETPRRFSQVDVRGALVLFLVGFIKKRCIADAIAPTVDRYFAAPWDFDAVSSWVGVLFYAVQIYCDFSGYTDMAIACARLFGYELTLNFRFPYIAREVADFWHRWHISLSSWLRDYLYISLGGNRGTSWFVYRNIMITMLLGGLWHGSAWTFVIWGTLHGCALVAHREWMRHAGRWPAIDQTINWIALPLTLYWVCLAWIFFRSPDLHHANSALNGFLFFRSSGTAHLAWSYLLLPVVLGCLHWLNSRQPFSNWWRKGPDGTFAFAYGCVAAVVLLFIPTEYAPFIYFQF